MNIKGIGTDRKHLVEALEKLTGTRKVYLGPPSFTYEIDVYSVLRDGSIEVRDEDLDQEILQRLIANGLVEDPVNREMDLRISLPLSGHNGATLLNLVNMIHCRQKFLNQALGRPGAFHIDEGAREKLAAECLEDAAGFIEKIQEIGGDKFKGIEFDGDKLIFTGFPLSEDPDENKAYTELAALMNKVALESHHLKSETVDGTNLKYSFRVWLIRIGMNGNDYKTTRKILLQKLPGHTAFRTTDQAELFKQRMKEKRDKAKEQAREEFHPL